MSEKKKSFPPSKSSRENDTGAKLRPMILKSDREIRKDPERKPREESEKPPTILLKAREPSTPKDERSQTPTNELNESQLINKTPLHETRDRKILEPKSRSPQPLMREPHKLIDENLEFNNAAVDFLNETNSSFLIVGVLGFQGVGKSTILNILLQEKYFDSISESILNSHNITEDEIPSGNNHNEFYIENNIDERFATAEKCYNNMKFKMQSLDQIELGLHCTEGVDMYITSDRVILLDSQPMCSSSILDENIGREGRGTGGLERTLHTDSLQIASFLMSVCHILILVQDWFTDCNFTRLILSSEMLRPTLSSSSNSTHTELGMDNAANIENTPHILMLHNKCQTEDYKPDVLKAVQDFYKKIFKKSKLQLKSGMYMYSESNRCTVEPVNFNMNHVTCGEPINLFLLPELNEDKDNEEICRGHPSFEELCSRLRWQVYGVNRHQMTSLPNMTEKCWFQYCNKAWEAIRKCTFFMEYGRLLP